MNSIDLVFRGLAGMVLAFLLAGVAAEAQQPADATVTTAEGSLSGVRQGDVDAFLGIPYAAAPVGQNRWRPPQPAAEWQGVRSADQFGANCIQPLGQGTVGPWTHEYVVTDNFDEDCLFLNVWRPRSASAAERLPVLVWIHGGGFTAGSGAVPIYDGRNLASRGIIVVTINYRLGPLGFLAHPELTAEAGDDIPTNFGIQDQVAALRWVQDNIEAFGGDADKVTIAGQSAGAMAVHTLVASPLASGLFRQAIAQAGLPTAGRAPELEAAEETGLTYMEQLGVASLEEMRALPADRFKPTPGQPRLRLRFGVSVDGRLLPAGPTGMVMSGRANDVPMIIGQNADEVLGFEPVAGTLTEEEWQTALQETFGSHADHIGALYPVANDHDRAEAFRQMRRDRAFAAIWLWGEARSEKNDSPLYVYLFGHVEPGPESDKWRSFHSNEIPYIFGTLDKSPERNFTFTDWQVSLTTSNLWAEFVRTGTPSAQGIPAWPRFRADEPRLLRIDAATEPLPMLSPAKREAFRAYVEDGGVLSSF